MALKPGELVFAAPKRGKKAPQHLSDVAAKDRKKFAEDLGLPGFRAKQVALHYYEHLNNNPETWSDIPADLRGTLKDLLLPELLTPVRSLECDRGRTRKDLWKMHDGVLVESVIMRYSDRATVCISSQAGCGMNCPFCATGQGGLTRNLTAGEITEQVVMAARALDSGEIPGGTMRLSKVVFMGMGEPLANYNAVIQSIRNITSPHPEGLGIGARSVTLSTVGLVPAIMKLIDEDIPVTLAVSLHAPDDATRAQLLPMGKRFAIADILAAADRFQAQHGRPVTIQYCLLKGVNDSTEHARMLAAVLGTRRMHVNLLRYNPTGLSLRGVSYEPASDETAEAFVGELRTRGVVAHFRRTRGPDIDAACGQLRRRSEQPA